MVFNNSISRASLDRNVCWMLSRKKRWWTCCFVLFGVKGRIIWVQSVNAKISDCLMEDRDISLSYFLRWCHRHCSDFEIMRAHEIFILSFMLHCNLIKRVFIDFFYDEKYEKKTSWVWMRNENRWWCSSTSSHSLAIFSYLSNASINCGLTKTILNEGTKKFSFIVLIWCDWKKKFCC